MRGFVIWAGRVVNALLIIAFVGGIIVHVADRTRTGIHSLVGLTVLLLLLLLHSQPYFALIGASGALIEHRSHDTARADSLLARIAYHKQRLFVPLGMAIVLSVLAAALGVLQMDVRVPRLTHGAFMILAVAAHLLAWNREKAAIFEIWPPLTEILTAEPDSSDRADD